MSNSVQPHRRQPPGSRPWDSPGKSPGVGCHFRLQCMKVKSESEVAQSCLTLFDPMDYSPPGSSVHGIFQARVLEWGAIAFSICWLLESIKWSIKKSQHQIWPLNPSSLTVKISMGKNYTWIQLFLFIIKSFQTKIYRLQDTMSHHPVSTTINPLPHLFHPANLFFQKYFKANST